MPELNRDECYRFDTFIPATLIRQVRVIAVMEDRDIADVVAEALFQYLDSHVIVEGLGTQVLGDPVAGRGGDPNPPMVFGLPPFRCPTCNGRGFTRHFRCKCQDKECRCHLDDRPCTCPSCRPLRPEILKEGS
jgi:hypothetical protein